MSIRVWVSAWQMQCCGTPFTVDGQVEWTLSTDKDVEWLASVVGRDIADSITHSEDHHGELPADAPTTHARVEAIQAVRSRFAPKLGGGLRVLYPVPDSGKLTPVSSADGWESEGEDLIFNGYVVDLQL